MTDVPLSTLIACGLGLVALPVAVLVDRATPRAPLPEHRLDSIGTLLIAVSLLFLQQIAMAGALLAVEHGHVVAGRALLLFPLLSSVAVAVVFLPRVMASTLSPGRAVAYGLLAFLAALPLVYGTVWVMEFFVGKQPAQTLVTRLAERGTGWVEIALIAVLLAPLCEELVFRGFLYPTLRRMRGPRPALLLSAGLFGLVHYDPPTAIFPLFVFGLVLGRLMEKTGSYLACVVAHMGFNLLTVATVLYSGSTAL